MATALSSFLLLPQRAFQASAQRLSLHPQLPHLAVSALTDLAVAPISTYVKAQHLATAVALRASVARPLVTVRRAARLHSARVRTPACHLMGHVEGPANTNARDLGLVIAAALRATAVQLPVTALLDARLDLEPVRLPTSRQTGLAEGQTVMSAKAQNLATAVAHLATVARLLDIALPAARQHSVHALLLTFHLMARVVAQRNTSAKVLAMAIVVVLPDTVESLQTTVAQAVNLGTAHAPR